MTTWAPVTKQSEIWTADAFPVRVFSPNVFSHGSYSGKFVFSMNPRGGVWGRQTITVETWTIKA